MHINESTLRWYDKDPTVSMAISILRNAQEHQIQSVIDKIFEVGQQNNIVLNEKKLKKIEKFFQRWYDKNEKLKEALEIMKELPEEAQNELAHEIIIILCRIEKTEYANFA